MPTRGHDAELNRRTLLRGLAGALGVMALGRAVAGCSDGTDNPKPFVANKKDPDPKDPSPTDADEHVPGKSPPVDAGDAPKIPVQSWEARAKQLEGEQLRVYGRATFARGDAGIFAGKENSHEPKPSLVMENGKTRVEVVVEHVMGANKLDAGVSDAGYDAASADSGPKDGGPKEGGADGGVADAGAPVPPPEHFITTIYLRAVIDGVDHVVGLWEFASTDAAPPTVRFTLPAGVKSVTAYEWCTLHGLWKSTPLAVP
jgi:hypothetical protein